MDFDNSKVYGDTFISDGLVGDSGNDSLGPSGPGVVRARIRSEFSPLFVMVVVVFLTLMVVAMVKVILTYEDRIGGFIKITNKMTNPR